jgi:hypothetical protein
MGAQPKQHMKNSRQDWHNDHKEHCRNPNGLGPKASKRDVRDAQQPLPFQAPYDIFRYTTKEMHNIASQHCTSKETT